MPCTLIRSAWPLWSASIELNGKVIAPGLPANTKEEQYLIDHMLTVIEAVGLQPAESKELLRRVSLIIDHRERTKQRPS